MEVAQTTFASDIIKSTPPSETTSRTKVSADFETFLKMLTVQMQNQDPLNPVDSSDYAVQLATFSSVEQQVKTNDLLAALGQQMGLTGLSQLAGWVGMEARVAAPAYFDGDPVTVYTNPPATAQSSILVVKNEAGQEVYRAPIDTAGGKVEWAGTGVNGQTVPAGNYQFDVESYADENLISSETAQIYTTVNEAKFDGTEMIVVLKGGAEVPASQVTAIRNKND